MGSRADREPRANNRLFRAEKEVSTEGVDAGNPLQYYYFSFRTRP